MLEPAAAGLSLPRAFLRVGGFNVARHQLALVLSLECQRVVCIARELGPELLALQHEAERAGAQFHVITTPRQLARLVTANDELLVLSDGLLVAPQAAQSLLESGHSVLTLPVESGAPLGFERLDLNHAFAGAMRIPGRLAERLAELPSDYDAISALTRVALQAGIAQRMVPLEMRDGAHWRLVRDEAEAHIIESGWIDLYLQHSQTMSPGAAISRLGVRAFGPALLHAGSGGNAVAAAAGTMLLIGLGAGWFGAAALALLFCGIAWLLRCAAHLLSRIERVSLSLPPSRLPRQFLFGWLLDAILVLLIVWSVRPIAWQSWPEFALGPLVLVCLLRILPRVFDRGWTAWLQDRALLCILLAAAAAFGILRETVEAMAAFAALAGALFARAGSRLTRGQPGSAVDRS